MVAVVLVAFFLATSLSEPRELACGKGKGLPKDEVILAKTRAGDFGIGKGDAFPYFVEIWYDPAQVSEIDRASLDKTVNLEPFEIRDIKETEFDLHPRTRVYQREYELQLIDGEVDRVYEFPAIVIRYKLKDSEGFADKAAVPEPIYVAPRLPPDVSNLELRLIKEKVEDPSRKYLLWVLWILGGLIAVPSIASLVWRGLPQWKEMTKQKRKVERDDVLYQAYWSLHGNVTQGAEPKCLLHQMDHILRVVLAQKEKVDWLEEPNLDLVSSGIRPSVISLFEKCQEACGIEVIEQKEMEEALRQLEEILKFYLAEEVEEWRN